MSHTPRVTANVDDANGKTPAASDIAMAAAQISFLSIPELFAEEVDRWIGAERERCPGTTGAVLRLTLARALGLEHERQVYRYMSGETPLPAALLARACRIFRSWRLLQAINQDAGLVAEPKPDVGKLDGFDLLVEQSHNLREFGEFVAAYVDSMQRRPSEIDAPRLEREGRDVIQQIERLIRYARELADRAGGRA